MQQPARRTSPSQAHTITSGSKRQPVDHYTEPTPPRRKATCLIFGEAGSGKSSFGSLYVPGPIAYHDLDHRAHYVCQEALLRGKVIKYLSLEFPRHIADMDEAEAQASAKIMIDKHWQALEYSVREAEKGNIRSITWDTGSELADMVNVMFTGRPERRNDDYGAASNMMKTELAEMIRLVREESKANLIILCHAKEVWETTGQTAGGRAKREATGKYTFRGPEVLGSAVDWAGHLRLAKTSVKVRGGDKAKKHELEVVLSKILLMMQGSVWDEDQWDEYGPFAFACSMLYPDSDVSDWME